jgi:hypothetical protein
VRTALGASLGACAAGLLVALTGCGFNSSGSSGSGPQLVIPASLHKVTVGAGHMMPGAENSFGGMVVCLDRKGQVTITGAKPVNPKGGIRIDQFGVRPSPFWKGGAGIIGQYGDLAHNHFKIGRTVDVTCDRKTGRGYEFAVAVSMSDGTEARMTGVEIAYTSAGHHRSLNFPITLFLCPHKIRGSESCRADDAA